MNREQEAVFANVREKISQKMDWVSEKSREKIPYTTINGVHNDCSKENISWWTNGFWAGMMWLMYKETGEEKYADIARSVEEKLDVCFEDFDCLNHDVGFMWLHTAVADYRLTQNDRSRKRALHAANILAGRFNHAGSFIRAWNNWGNGTDNRGWAIIDCMMNLPLLYWASEQTNDPRYCQTAMKHADMAQKYFVREDGSVRHIIMFDPESGAFVGDQGGQGYAQGSSWTRGQGWGLYGFTLSYLHTKKPQYLETARKIAAYVLSQIPENGLLPVDFCQPKEPAWQDSTAGAIAACGFLELAKLVDGEEKIRYQEAGEKLLLALSTHNCNWSKNNDCILERCTAAYHDQEHETNIIYGDYFFMEGIFKLYGEEAFLW